MKKIISKKGFTLMEMLIVVAIIAVLVAIAIPTFTSSLTKAKQAADNANVRAAYAEASTQALAEGRDVEVTVPGTMQAASDTTVIGSIPASQKSWKAGATVKVKVTKDGAVTLTATGGT